MVMIKYEISNNPKQPKPLKNKPQEFIIPHFKIYYKTTVIKIVKHRHKDRHR